VGIDGSDDADVPSDKHSDHAADRADASANGGRQAGRAPAETRYRQAYDADLRAAVGGEERTEPAGRAEPGARSKAGEPAENGQQAKPAVSWEEMAERARWMWGEYKRRFPPEERPPVDRSKDSHGKSNEFIDSAVNHQLEQECDHIVDREQKIISPRLREVESQDPDRKLVGFERRLKDRDRIKEKLYDDIDFLRRSPREAISLLPDAIRYTFQYDEARYTKGVLADIGRLKEQGFELEKLKNYWSDDQYKGINSQWIEPGTGQRFEVQFHTRISFEAKEITHDAYERLRTHQADAFEELVLEAFQKKVSAAVPIPPGAADIPDYPERERNAR
jgi:hypothetical protein